MQKETRRNSAAGSTKPNPPRKLTRAEKKQIAEIIRQAKGDGKAHTAQQTIPYIQMYPECFYPLCLTTELCPVLPNFRKRKTLQSSKKDYNAL